MAHQRLFLLGFIVFILAACQLFEPSIPTKAASEEIFTPTHTPEPLTCEEVEGNCFRLVFDGENCSYQGPEIQEPGSMTLLFINNGDGFAQVNLMWHRGDETIQDMMDYLGDEPSTEHTPTWANALGPWEIVGPGRRYTSVHILKTGIHTMVCADTRYGWWLGGGFTVEE